LPTTTQRPRGGRLRRLLVGRPRDLRDPSLIHQVSLVAFLAWVGLGADGLSSSAYGPDEAYRVLLQGGDHRHLALALALAVAGTVAILSAAYARIVEHFPSGAGGYAVAPEVGPRVAVVSGCALLVDYVLTVATSVAASCDAFLSMLPESWQRAKLTAALVAIAALVVLNLRGVKESVRALTPIFLAFVVLHVILIAGAFLVRADHLGAVASEVRTGFVNDVHGIGLGGMALLLGRAYSLGGGTYTGIEAVSNGLAIMREPRVRTAKRTMLFMAVSLALCASGILLAYLLVDARPEAGKTMNAVLAERFVELASVKGVRIGSWFTPAVLATEAALLLVAAQAGFLDGPRVMAGLARDGWLPRRFSSLSDRLAMQNGIVLTGVAAALVLVETGGSIGALVTLYAINVFVTFSISQWGMLRFLTRKKLPGRPLHAVALALCLAILATTLHEKLFEGGWVTLAVTGALVVACLAIRRHYDGVAERLAALDRELPPAPDEPPASMPLDPHAPTAILFVRGYRAVGARMLDAIDSVYPGYYRNVVFVSVGIVDAHVLSSHEALAAVTNRGERELAGYLAIARERGLAARVETAFGTEVPDEVVRVARRLSRELDHAHFFIGRVVFEEETFVTRLLHNDTSASVAHRLQLEGIPTFTVPTRLKA
jgi:amino acid transporter